MEINGKNIGLSKKTNIAIAGIAAIATVAEHTIAITAITAICLVCVFLQFCIDRKAKHEAN